VPGVALLLSLTLMNRVPAGAASAVPGGCADLGLPVALSPSTPPDQVIAGTLCLPAGGVRQVDVLVHGATYNRAYWDWPAASLSFVKRELAQHRATLAYDRPGAGRSSRPPGALANGDAEAYVLHQLVAWARTRVSAKVAVVGHSLGSVVVAQEAATYRDVDLVALTGLAHAQGPGLVQVSSDLYPAASDPSFLGRVLDPEYVTTRPRTRGVFYGPTADPTVVAADDAHKDVTSGAAADGAFQALALPAADNPTSLITAPVLEMLGGDDTLFCGSDLDCSSSAALAAHDAPWYGAARSFTAIVIAHTGHNLALHPSAQESFDAYDDWVRNR
jgi:alpha-beta hydrolase superfamily lysophospholipase